MNTNNKYNIAVFEENDSADLIEYSEKMKDTIETALDNNKGEKGDIGPAPIKGTDYFTNEEIQEIESNVLDRVNQFSVEVVEILPSENISEHTIYFMPQKNAKQQDVYDEYMFINEGWEHIGTTEVDLSNYYNKEQVDEKVETRTGDSLPIGTIVEYEGETVPEGYEEVEENEIVISTTEPTGNDRKRVWLKNGIDNAIFVKNSNDIYEEFVQKKEEIYSTEERVVGKWINGKPLYRKVIVSNGNVGEEVAINHNISNFRQATNITATATSSKGFVTYPNNNNKYSLIITSINNTSIVAKIGNAFGDWDIYFTLEYIKTTD